MRFCAVQKCEVWFSIDCKARIMIIVMKQNENKNK